MQVLFSGDFVGQSDLAKLLRSYATSLEHTNCEFVISPLDTKDLSYALAEKCKRPDNWDADIRMYGEPPNLYSSTLHHRALAIFDWPTDRIPNNHYGPRSDWVYRLNLMDMLVVPSKFVMRTLRINGVMTPCRVVPYRVSTAQFSALERTELLDGNRNPIHAGWFKFVCSLSSRGDCDYASLFLAYLTAFATEQTALIVYTPNETEAAFLQKYVTKLKKSLKLRHRGARIFFVPPEGSEDIRLQLYKACDCFVTTSKGSGSAIDVLEAQAVGLPTIVPDGSAFAEYVDESLGYLVQTTQEPVYDVPDAPFLYTDQNWHRVDILDLQRRMREAYQYRNSLDNRAKETAKRLHTHSAEDNAFELSEILEDLMADPSCTSVRTEAAAS